MATTDQPPFELPPPATPPAYNGPDQHTHNGHHPTPTSTPNGTRRDPVEPHDLDAERYILGALLLDPTQLDPIRRTVTGPDFYEPRHELIWRTLIHLAGTDQPLEPQAVIAHLRDTKQLTELNALGGPPYLFALIESCTAPTNAAYYARRVDQLARRRRAITELTRGLTRLQAPGASGDIDQALTDSHQLLAEALANLADGPDTNSTWSPVDLGPVLAGDHLDPPPTMLRRSDGQPLLYDGAVHSISGESESGKTWLCLLAVLQLIQDGDRAVFLDFEDRAERVIARLLALGATIPQLRENFAYIRPDRPLDDTGRAALAPHLIGTRLVILDGVTEAMTMHGYDLNSNADSALFQSLLPRWVADHGPATVLIDHVVKDKEKQGRFALGAQHKLAGIDGVAYLVKTIVPFSRGKRGIARVEVSKDRPGHVREYAHGKTIAEFTLDATGGEHTLLAHLMPVQLEHHGDTTAFEPTHLMEKISRYVQANPGLSKKVIESAMNGKTDTKRLALELLVTRGYIGVKTGPRGAVQHFHHNPFYADQETTDETPEPATDTTLNTPEAEAS